MNTISIRFYGPLNDFISKGVRNREGSSLIHTVLPVNQSVKDLIESYGVPHTEVELIIVNGKPVDFNYTVQPGEYISVFPEFSSIDVTTITNLKSCLPNEIKFVIDVHLGKLTKYLRILGLDAAYKNDYSDSEIIKATIEEKRIMLTRDIGLLKNNKVVNGYWVRNTDPFEQAEEIISKFNLKDKIKPFTRCLSCNGEIEPVDKERIINKLEPKTIQYYNEFFICPACRKIYWKGSHWKKMEEMIYRFKNA